VTTGCHLVVRREAATGREPRNYANQSTTRSKHVHRFNLVLLSHRRSTAWGALLEEEPIHGAVFWDAGGATFRRVLSLRWDKAGHHHQRLQKHAHRPKRLFVIDPLTRDTIGKFSIVDFGLGAMPPLSPRGAD